MGIDNKMNQSAAAELRWQAEERLQSRKAKLQPARTMEESQRIVHELEVHQIELYMQNEELRQSREKLEKALDKYTDLYDFAPVGYFTLDRSGNISAVNLAGAGLFGIERTQLLDKQFGLFVADEARLLLVDFLEKVFVSRAKECCELTLTTTKNSPLFVQIEALADASGQECRVAVINISARRQLEEKLELLYNDLADRAAELAAANIELEAFNYTVSHDLRRPLTVIHGYCQVLRELCGDQTNEQSKEYIQEIYDGALRMNRLITSLLKFSRVTRSEMHRELFDLSMMAQTVAEEMKKIEPERRVKFRITEGLIDMGDKTLWKIVLDNLMGNAWKYCTNKEETVIELGRTEREGKPVYFVRDNGPGFDMMHAGKLFIPFQRLPEADFEGDGIGLATVQKIVHRHGGRVWAESKPGEGATFFFTMD